MSSVESFTSLPPRGRGFRKVALPVVERVSQKLICDVNDHLIMKGEKKIEDNLGLLFRPRLAVQHRIT